MIPSEWGSFERENFATSLFICSSYFFNLLLEMKSFGWKPVGVVEQAKKGSEQRVGGWIGRFYGDVRHAWDLHNLWTMWKEDSTNIWWSLFIIFTWSFNMPFSFLSLFKICRKYWMSIEKIRSFLSVQSYVWSVIKRGKRKKRNKRKKGVREGAISFKVVDLFAHI